VRVCVCVSYILIFDSGWRRLYRRYYSALKRVVVVLFWSIAVLLWATMQGYLFPSARLCYRM
jgi:hypothetical protein